MGDASMTLYGGEEDVFTDCIITFRDEEVE